LIVREHLSARTCGPTKPVENLGIHIAKEVFLARKGDLWNRVQDCHGYNCWITRIAGAVDQHGCREVSQVGTRVHYCHSETQASLGRQIGPADGQR
jgi:hypothetical protein